MKRWCLVFALALVALAACTIVDPSDRGGVSEPFDRHDADVALDAGADAAPDAGPDAAR